MIAFEDMLSEEEIWAIVNYIRELGKSSVQAQEFAENK
jgi:mono/diheme cytochrome c family protein